MSRVSHSPGSGRLAVATALMALLLIGVGGLVTSHGAGMAVPDWPTTYGYNMFLFPLSHWTGGIFYEHTHRLLAAGVGLLTLGLAVWLWLKEQRRWLRWLGALAAFLVVLQGVLGGLRVTEMMSELGIVHATLAQMFLVLVCAIALFTSRAWQGVFRRAVCARDFRWLNRVLGWVTGLVLAQLIVAATMRHQHAGLAIPDFPLAYGRIWPAMDAQSIARYNRARLEVTALNPITASQVALHMAHRIMALVVLGGVLVAAMGIRRRLGSASPLTKLSWIWLGAIVAQALLGATTVWTGKAPIVATLHVAIGAISLVVGVLLILLVRRSLLVGPASLGQAGEVAQEAGFARRAAEGTA